MMMIVSWFDDSSKDRRWRRQQSRPQIDLMAGMVTSVVTIDMEYRGQNMVLALVMFMQCAHTIMFNFDMNVSVPYISPISYHINV